MNYLHIFVIMTLYLLGNVNALTKEQAVEIFGVFDADGSSAWSKKEFSEFIISVQGMEDFSQKKLSEEEIEHSFDMLDVDQSGDINFAEYEKLVEEGPGSGIGDEEEEEEVEYTDRDGNVRRMRVSDMEERVKGQWEGMEVGEDGRIGKMEEKRIKREDIEDPHLAKLIQLGEISHQLMEKEGIVEGGLSVIRITSITSPNDLRLKGEEEEEEKDEINSEEQKIGEGIDSLLHPILPKTVVVTNEIYLGREGEEDKEEMYEVSVRVQLSHHPIFSFFPSLTSVTTPSNSTISLSSSPWDKLKSLKVGRGDSFAVVVCGLGVFLIVLTLALTLLLSSNKKSVKEGKGD